MKYATRLNSFISKEKSLKEVIFQIGSINEIKYLDLNYPEHFKNNTVDEIKNMIAKNNLKVNGIAPRFREDFVLGEFTNKDDRIRNKAINITKEAIDICRVLGGQVVTIWLGYDGYDYPFQLNYDLAWKKVVQALQEICDYAKEIKISIEYKPYQPRAFSLVSSFGETMMLINDVNRENIGLTLDFCHMLMKGENPSCGLSIAGSRRKIMGFHLNDGHRLNDDGFMVGSINLMQTLEFIYYYRKLNLDEVIYFDTFPIRENAIDECKMNIELTNKLFHLVDTVGEGKIDQVIEKNDAIEVQKLLLNILR